MIENWKLIFELSKTYPVVVRDSSAVRRLFVRLAGAVGRQSALHKENSGFAAPTLGQHISTFRGYQILFSIWNPYINRFTNHFYIHSQPCYTRLQHDFALDPIISPFDFHFRTYKRDLAILTEWWQQRIAWWELLNAACQIICVRKQQHTNHMDDQGFQSGTVPGTFTHLRSCIVPAEITEPPKISGGQNHKYDGR